LAEIPEGVGDPFLEGPNLPIAQQGPLRQLRTQRQFVN
jgi:hypothetical protein